MRAKHEESEEAADDRHGATAPAEEARREEASATRVDALALGKEVVVSPQVMVVRAVAATKSASSEAKASDFATLVHTHELAALRKMTGAQSFGNSLASYTDTLTPLVEALMTETSKLARMHQARTS